MNVCLFLVLLFIDLFRGSKKEPSIFGIKTCSWQDFGSLAVFVGICVFMSLKSLKVLEYEQQLKIRYGDGLVASDVNLVGRKFRVFALSFAGGFVSGALGLGGGSIFNPLLLSLGLPPKVASATGMYMLIFSTGASSMTFIFNDMLHISYGLWVGSFCVLGSVAGMLLLEKVMKKLGRQSPLVMLLCLMLGISCLAVPFFGIQ